MAPLPAASLLSSLPPAALTGLVCECASNSDIEGVRALLIAGARINAGTAYDSRTPLHLAAAAGNLVMCKFLIEECEAGLHRDRFGLLPIHDAVQNGHNEVRRYLQSQRLAEDSGLGGRVRAGSMETFTQNPPGVDVVSAQQLADLQSTVFELVVKEGVFSYTAVLSEVQHFFVGLGFHTVYFTHFTAMQIARHVHCLIAAKHVARATDDIGGLEFDLKSERSGFFLSSLGEASSPTDAQRSTEDKVADYLTLCMNGNENVALTFMASEGPAFQEGGAAGEHLAIYIVDKGHFEVSATRVSEGETSLEILASSRFLKTKSQVAKEQYQVVMEDVVASRRSVVRIVHGSVYPGPHPGGYVVIFATAETAGRHYLHEICQAMRFVHLVPRRFYLENFVNGVLTYSLFFPHAKMEEMEQLKSTIMYSTHLKATPGGSALVYSSVMQSSISYQCGLYLLAAVKFVYTFFPKEQYAREYTSVHKVLDQNEGAQRKLESLYKLCIKGLLSTERIYQLVHRHAKLAKQFYDEFRKIATGQLKPHFNEVLGLAIDNACNDPQDRQIMRMFLTFNESMLMTNFFKAEIPGAFAFRLDPAVVLKDRPTSMYPEIPYGIYMVIGRDFMGFHTRFREVARGGIRLIQSRDKATYGRNFATLFDEGYNLAFTQQNKNKDIPEGGAKGVILPDSCWSGAGHAGAVAGNVLAGTSTQSPAAQKSCFIRYLDALIDCMLPEQGGIYTGHMEGKTEMLFFGPDENTAGYMDLGAELAHVRGYPYWKALTTGKGTALGGIPHDTYGMTTASVHKYVIELLRELGEDESKITKFQTGGPDGDLGSNEILLSKDRTVGIVDGSGVLYDPAGLNRTELTRLATRRVMVKDFSRAMLGSGGFLVTIEETDVTLPDGSQWLTGAELRDNFHLTDFATADLFVPCGGRPNAVTTDNVKKLFTADGAKPKFRIVVEGANLFLSDGARQVLEKAGVHVFKDASTNKGGVNSSSLEVLAALALPVDQHSALMCFDPKNGGTPPGFYTEYVQQIQEIIIENAAQEFHAIWKANQQQGVPKVEATKLISGKITKMQDSIMDTFQKMSENERSNLVRQVLSRAVPPVMVRHLGIDGILKNVPASYITALVSAWIASRFVYKNGINTSEVSFFFFLKSLLTADGDPNGAA